MSKVGFVTMGESAGGEDIPTVGVGMLGYGFMGKAHSNAYKTLAYMTWPPPLMPQLVSIAGRNEEAVAAAAGRYGFADHVTDWHKLVDRPADRRLRQLRPEQLPRRADDRRRRGRQARDLREAARAHRRRGLRDLAARRGDRREGDVRLQLPLRPGRAAGASEIIAAGDLGEIFHFRGRYLQEWIIDADFPMVWRLDKDVAGSGALGDLGAHVIDLARYLVGEIDAVSASHAHVRQGPRGRAP